MHLYMANQWEWCTSASCERDCSVQMIADDKNKIKTRFRVNKGTMRARKLFWVLCSVVVLIRISTGN